MTTIFMLPAPPPASGPIGTDGQSRPGSPTTDFASVLDAARAPIATVLPFTRGGAGTAGTGFAGGATGEDVGGAAAAAAAVIGVSVPTTADPTAPTAPTEPTEPTAPAEQMEPREPAQAAATVTSLPTTTTATATAAGVVPADDGVAEEGTESALADVVALSARTAHATSPGAATPAPVPAVEATTASAPNPTTPAETGVGRVGGVPRALPATPTAAASTGTAAATTGDLPTTGTAIADSPPASPAPGSASPVDASTSGVVGVRVPTQHAAPVAVPEAPVPAAPALGSQVAEQLRAKVPGLRAAGLGQHILTLRVEPESIGPVRVIAHIGVDGVRVELLGGTEAARDALRTALPDLRRDLAGSGLTDLNLGPDGGDGGRGRDDAPARRRGSEPAETREAVLPQPVAGGSDRSRSRLDLLV